MLFLFLCVLNMEKAMNDHDKVEQKEKSTSLESFHVSRKKKENEQNMFA